MRTEFRKSTSGTLRPDSTFVVLQLITICLLTSNYPLVKLVEAGGAGTPTVSQSPSLSPSQEVLPGVLLFGNNSNRTMTPTPSPEPTFTQEPTVTILLPPPTPAPPTPPPRTLTHQATATRVFTKSPDPEKTRIFTKTVLPTPPPDYVPAQQANEGEWIAAIVGIAIALTIICIFIAVVHFTSKTRAPKLRTRSEQYGGAAGLDGPDDALGDAAAISMADDDARQGGGEPSGGAGTRTSADVEMDGAPSRMHGPQQPTPHAHTSRDTARGTPRPQAGTFTPPPYGGGNNHASPGHTRGVSSGGQSTDRLMSTNERTAAAYRRGGGGFAGDEFDEEY